MNRPIKVQQKLKTGDKLVAFPQQPPTLELVRPPEWTDYELIDSGGGMKLERFGRFRLSRPEAEAVWQPRLPQSEWDSADATYQPAPEENGGHWMFRRKLPEQWNMHYQQYTFEVRTSASRHVGLFPEQASQWDWIAEQTRTAGRPLQVLNLFGYTGIASLAAAGAGARVTHVDASRKVIEWARRNQQLSGMGELPIRWIIDDAVKFVQRESRRKAAYDGLILDPPKFGRGPKGEVWEFYRLLPALLRACRQALSAQPRFVVLTAYAVKASAVTLYHAVEEMMADFSGITSAGEAVLVDRSGARTLSMAVFARWAELERVEEQ
ncbi:MAG: class I SAM-dependent methyltransferase [Anaerolineaceae bacterium]|nr:class I SAM-dependent methyltransferase [Anaerolineaceae bacterium]